jgi:hypothetical protein
MAEEDKHDEQEKNFHMVFYRMSEMVKRMYGDYEKRMKKKERKKEAHAVDDASVNQGVGGDPLEPLYFPSSSSSSSENSHHSQHSNHKTSFKKPLLKLDVNFSLPMFNGDANHEKLDNLMPTPSTCRLEGPCRRIIFPFPMAQELKMTLLFPYREIYTHNKLSRDPLFALRRSDFANPVVRSWPVQFLKPKTSQR